MASGRQFQWLEPGLGASYAEIRVTCPANVQPAAGDDAVDHAEEARPGPVVLCADDFGTSSGVSRGIVELLDAGRVSATSCMVLDAGWAGQAAMLAPFAGRVDIGLHLTLTDQTPLTAMPRTAPGGALPPLSTVLGRAMSGRLNRAEIEREIEHQLDRFEAAIGRPPDFLDGHHHVHQMPVIGGAVLGLYRRRLAGAGAGTGAWIRNSAAAPPRIVRRGIAVPKTLAIAALGRRFRAAIRRRGIATNGDFAGVYDLSRQVPYRRLFRRFLDGQRGGGLIMCHPGYAGSGLADSLTIRREE